MNYDKICTCFSGEYSEAVVPETTSDQEATVNRGDKTIGANPDLLTEVVTEMSSLSGTGTCGGLSCRNTSEQQHTYLICCLTLGVV